MGYLHPISAAAPSFVVYHTHFIWTGICNSIPPRSPTKATDQALGPKATKGCGIAGTKTYSANGVGNKDSNKLKSWDKNRVWWQPILTRGELHVVAHGVGFPGDPPEAAPLVASKVRAAINMRFPSEQPDILLTDRGKSFFDACTGKITQECKQAAKDVGFKVSQGDDASAQPGQSKLGQVILHETAVSWSPKSLHQCRQQSSGWKEVEEYGDRLKSIAQDINDNF